MEMKVHIWSAFLLLLAFMGFGFILVAGEIHGYPIDLGDHLAFYGMFLLFVGCLGFMAVISSD